jgi:hypothetical protein
MPATHLGQNGTGITLLPHPSLQIYISLGRGVIHH